MSVCIKGLGVINPKRHKRNITIRFDKQHNYTLVLKKLSETEISNQKYAAKKKVAAKKKKKKERTKQCN